MPLYTKYTKAEELGRIGAYDVTALVWVGKESFGGSGSVFIDHSQVANPKITVVSIGCEGKRVECLEAGKVSVPLFVPSPR